MGANRVIVLCCFLLALTLSCQGLQLYLERTLGAQICGRLVCSNTAQPDGPIFTTTSISVYDVSKTGSRTLLASIIGNGANLNINPLRAADVTGNGSLSRYQAELSLNFSNETDCLQGNFQCELQYVNIQGQVDSISQSTGSDDHGDGTSCCAVLAYQLSKLAARLDEAEGVIFGLKQNQSNLEQSVALLKQQNVILEDRLNVLTTQVANIQNAATTSKPAVEATTAAVTTAAATTSQEITGQGECIKGETVLSSRWLFNLWGRVPALCDMETDGGGWVIVQRRVKGDMDFYKLWNDYKVGFGTPNTDYWIGLDVIHNLTAQGYNELRIDMELNGVKYYAHYSIFNVDNEVLNYKLTVSGYSGSAGDSLTYHNGMLFSTSDRDHDKDYDNCARLHTSAWWYNSCYKANLNGVWGKNAEGGVIWHGISKDKSLTFTEIKVRVI